MATHDHTVRIRPSVPPDGTITPPSGDPPRMRVAWPDSLHSWTRSDIALTVLAFTRLRVDSEQRRHAQARGFPGRAQQWPLSAAVTASLGIAIHCLQQYARLLGHGHREYPPRVR